MKTVLQVPHPDLGFCQIPVNESSYNGPSQVLISQNGIKGHAPDIIVDATGNVFRAGVLLKSVDNDNSVDFRVPAASKL